MEITKANPDIDETDGLPKYIEDQGGRRRMDSKIKFYFKKFFELTFLFLFN